MMNILSQLNNIDLKKKVDDKIVISNVYNVIEGGYGIDGVKTYSTAAQVSELVNDIEIFETLTKDKSWPVSSIIQREIDDRRVELISKDYILRKNNNVKYFPPLVIAIVPKDSKGEIYSVFPLKDSTDESEKELILQKSTFDNQLSENFKNSEDLSCLDGFYVLDWLQGHAKHALAWDKNKVYAVVIDGQHRLQALKISAKQDPVVANFLQDIVFIDLSNKATKENRTPVEAIRRIFIDINYNAKPVSQARRCLMDDKDLSSLLVQSLVNDDDVEGKRQGKFLLPQLVDWHSDNQKHQLPHITGVLVLQQLMSDELLSNSNIVSMEDMRHPKKVEDFVQTLNTRLKVDERIKYEIKYNGIIKLKDSLTEYQLEIDKQRNSDENKEGIANKEDTLFSFDYNTLNVARDSFEEIYSKSIVYFFNNLLPYKEAIDILTNNNVFKPGDVRNRLLVKSPKKYLPIDIEEFNVIKESLNSKLKDKYYLLFTVLGQKTLFKMFFKNLMSDIGGDYTEKKVFEFTQDWVNKMNKIIYSLCSQNFKIFGENQKDVISKDIQKEYNIEKYGSLSSSFWQGIIFNDNSIVYNTQGIGGFLGVLEYIRHFFNINQHQGGNSLEIKIPSSDSSYWNNIPYSKTRIKNKIITENYCDNQAEAVALSEEIWKAKKAFLDQLLVNAMKRKVEY